MTAVLLVNLVSSLVDVFIWSSQEASVSVALYTQEILGGNSGWAWSVGECQTAVTDSCGSEKALQRQLQEPHSEHIRGELSFPGMACLLS